MRCVHQIICPTLRSIICLSCWILSYVRFDEHTPFIESILINSLQLNLLNMNKCDQFEWRKSLHILDIACKLAKLNTRCNLSAANWLQWSRDTSRSKISKATSLILKYFSYPSGQDAKAISSEIDNLGVKSLINIITMPYDLRGLTKTKRDINRGNRPLESCRDRRFLVNVS